MEKQTFYPPVVAVLGHVDHGKTTLLDAIRKTSVATREHGGITQSIGASRITVQHEGVTRVITFIDTPGHAAFANMRGRGATAADIGILVVAATDGVMPQTKESIELLKAAKIPFIVALTKSDVPTKNVEKVKQQLLKEGIMLEGLGGDVPVIEVSAKEGKNIKELLELILLVQEMNLPKASEEKEIFQGVIIESKLDLRIGPKATLVVKHGTIAVRDEVVAGTVFGKVRSLINDQGKMEKQASRGDAVEILGFTHVPPVGSIVMKKSEAVAQVAKVEEIVSRDTTDNQPYFINIEASPEHLAIVLCADTQGALEAIVAGLPEEVQVPISKTGEITTADVLFAKSIGAIVIGFNAIVKNDVKNLAQTEKILLKNYTIIYELLDEIKDVLEGKKIALEERIFGKARILASFPFEKTKVLGVAVLEGRVAKGDQVDVMRGETLLGEGTITSLRQGKNSTSKVEKGQEAGVIVSPLLDFTIGDMLVSHS